MPSSIVETSCEHAKATLTCDGSSTTTTEPAGALRIGSIVLIVVGLGAQSWLSPRVAILRDAEGREIPPTVVETDGLAPPGESVVEDFSQVTEHDLQRLETLRDAVSAL